MSEAEWFLVFIIVSLVLVDGAAALVQHPEWFN